MAESTKTTEELIAELALRLLPGVGTSALVRLVVDVFGCSLFHTNKNTPMGIDAGRVTPITVSVMRAEHVGSGAKTAAQNDLERFLASTPRQLVQDFDLSLSVSEKEMLKAISANKGRLESRYNSVISVFREDNGRVISLNFQSNSLNRSMSFKVAV
jgi:hypothetical protein